MKYVTFLLCLLLNVRAFAILNVESIRQDQEEGYNGTINMNIAGQKGNSDTSIYTLKTLTAHINSEEQYLFYRIIPTVRTINKPMLTEVQLI